MAGYPPMAQWPLPFDRETSWPIGIGWTRVSLFSDNKKTYITHIDPSNCCILRVTKTHFWCILTMHVLVRPTRMKPPTSLTWSPLNVQCFYPNYLSKSPLIHWHGSTQKVWFRDGSRLWFNRCINRQPMWLKLPRVYGPLVGWWNHYPVVNLAEPSRSDLVLRSLWFYRYFMDIIYDAQPKNLIPWNQSWTIDSQTANEPH
jgi:hypothetical protein